MKNKTSILFITLLCSICGLFTSCGSIVNGTTQKVTVTSDPAGATVSNGEVSMITPATFELKRKRPYIFSVSKPGFKTETAKVERVISGAVAANILLGYGGLIGWGVDAISGGQWRLAPENLHVSLRPEAPMQIAQNQVQPPLALPTVTKEESIVVEKEEVVTQ